MDVYSRLKSFAGISSNYYYLKNADNDLIASVYASKSEDVSNFIIDGILTDQYGGSSDKIIVKNFNDIILTGNRNVEIDSINDVKIFHKYEYRTNYDEYSGEEFETKERSIILNDSGITFVSDNLTFNDIENFYANNITNMELSDIENIDVSKIKFIDIISTGNDTSFNEKDLIKTFSKEAQESFKFNGFPIVTERQFLRFTNSDINISAGNVTAKWVINIPTGVKFSNAPIMQLYENITDADGNTYQELRLAAIRFYGNYDNSNQQKIEIFFDKIGTEDEKTGYIKEGSTAGGKNTIRTIESGKYTLTVFGPITSYTTSN